MTGGHVAHPLLISLANILMDFRTKASNHAFHLLALLPTPNFIHKDRKIRGVLKNCLIHDCLDFILQPLKKAAQVGIMMSDLLGSLCYVYMPLAAYIVDTQEAVVLAGVAGKTSHLTTATYKEFGNAFIHLPCTASMTLKQLIAIEKVANPWDLDTYIQYFLMPLTFLQECEDSAGIHQNPLEWDQNPLESTGMKLDSTGITIFLQE